MIKKYNLFLGLNDKKTKTQLINTLEAYKLLMNYFSNATITEATGFYKHNDGTVIIEKSLKIEILDFDNIFNLFATCETLKTLFNQESIAVQTEIIDSQLI